MSFKFFLGDLKTKINWIYLVGLLFILFLTADVIFLTLQNRELKEMLKSMTLVESTEPLQSGERVSPITVKTFDGTRREFDYSDSLKRHLLFVLSTSVSENYIM